MFFVVLTWRSALVMICEATPTMFLELVSSFFELGSGSALADAVIQSISRKPGERRKKRISTKFRKHPWPTFAVTVNISISFLL